MNLLLVSPPFGEKGQMSKGLPIAPPVLEYLAGLTRQVDPGVGLSLLDANKEVLVPEEVAADAVCFTVLTPQAPWVYRMADRLRALGKQVVLGGIHVSALPEEAKVHADAIVLGEAETIWARVLADLARGAPEPVYRGDFPELVGLPHPVTDLWNTKYVYGYFQTSRGCPHRCTFCSVHEFFGGRARVRPIAEVVAEVAASKRRLFWGIDDNIWGVDVKRSIELYAEMARSIRAKWWFGSGDLVTLDHARADELLDNARRAGLTAVLVGWESNNLATLEEYRAVGKQGRHRRDQIKRIRDHGIEVMLFTMLGGRQDVRADYDELLELCDELKVSAHPVMTTPFPGTALYAQYEPYLVPGHDWDDFDGNHAVFEHPTLGVAEREDLVIDLRARLFTLPRILKRVVQVGWRGFPMSHVTSWMIQFPQGRAFTEYAREHARRRAGGADEGKVA
ncbi:B12-binding domain-containing radical SAM protein [Anaeromyxobacter oryzisoli]|uniref:B12-binding domain-containing radical SAM protein n=1 Tax=Anaeromyxobacter oryzisoli TaxID=2925408 RepID=UPI001F55FFA9|nr:radical SAM protein [Anaeromyxobacter sp. SG63]